MMFHGDDYSTTLFLGDLSVHCTERDIRKLFRPFGTIEAIRIKRGSNTKTNLSYGFIKFSNRQSAELAITQVNGLMFLGRCIRIGWATGKDSPKLPSDMFDNEGNSPSLPSNVNDHNNNKKSARKETAQIHVSFISKQVEHLISEATLRSLFSNYGEVLDVALKKSQFDKNLRIQNGYGFVHFALNPDGVRGAIAAVNALHQVTIDRITYDCSISHALADYLVSHGIPLPRGTTHPSLANNNQQNAHSEQLSVPLSTPEDYISAGIGSSSSINWLENNVENTTIDSNGTSNARLLNSSFSTHSSLLPLEDRSDTVGESTAFRAKVITAAPIMYLTGKSNTVSDPFVNDLDRFDQQYFSRENDYSSAGGSISSIRSHPAFQLASQSYSSRHPPAAHYPQTASLPLPQRPDSYYQHHSPPLSAIEDTYYRPLESLHRLQTSHFHQLGPHYSRQSRPYEDHYDHKISFPGHSSHNSKQTGSYRSLQQYSHYPSQHPRLAPNSHTEAPPHHSHHHPYSLHTTTLGSNSEARLRHQHQQFPHSEAYVSHGRTNTSSIYLPSSFTAQRGASTMLKSENNYLYNSHVHERHNSINMHHTYEREKELSSSESSHSKMQEKESIPLASNLSLISLDSEQDLSLSHFSSFTTNASFPTTGMNISSLSVNPAHLDSSNSVDIAGMNDTNLKTPLHQLNSLQSCSSSTSSFPPAIVPSSQSQSTSAASSAYQILAPDGTELTPYSPGL